MIYATLYLLNYNNYYNRIVKKENTLQGYMPYLLGNPIPRVNFIPNDYINTTQVINWNTTHPDYMLVVDENGEIESRWFVVSTSRIRNGQLELTLHRDLIVDFYDNIMDNNTKIFIEKAIIPESNDLIFNMEDMTFNEIKTKETLLKDDTQCPWIVLYGARKNGEGQTTTFSSTFVTDYPSTEITAQEYQELMQYAESASGDYKPIYGTPSATSVLLNEAKNGRTEVTTYLLSSAYDNPISATTQFAPSTGPVFVSNVANVLSENKDEVLAGLAEIASAYIDEINSSLYNNILLNQGKYLKYTPSGSTSKYYKISIYATGEDNTLHPTSFTGSIQSTLQPLLNAFNNPNQVVIGTTALNSNINVQYTAPYVRYRLEEVSAPQTEGDGDVVTIGSNRYHLVDAPYDMFCLPLSDTLLITNSKRSGFTQVKSNKFLNLAVANQLVSDYAGVGQIYDAQILPYCPLVGHQMTTDAQGNLVYDIYDDSVKSYSVIQASQGRGIIGYVLHASQSSFSLSIDLEEPIVIQNYKIESECDMYRLNSPNYGSSFEFNAAKNGGVTTINVACTYKPYGPYIKVYPNWGRLYGSNFNDARGLICGGDFSLPTLTDQWKTYELQNKNYQASFDRQIENMEIQQKYQRTSEIIGAVVGTAQGAGSGAGAGMLMGGPVGAGIGAAIGGISSLVGGIADVAINDKLRQEALDYTKDQFGYQLGNIKALPNTLSRTSAYNIDNKYFPFLEYYTCSPTERKALAYKVAYNGMTTMVIGNISDYINNTWEYEVEGETIIAKNYIKGKVIRIVGIQEDFHMINAIADELNKGVYLNG